MDHKHHKYTHTKTRNIQTNIKKKIAVESPAGGSQTLQIQTHKNTKYTNKHKKK